MAPGEGGERGVFEVEVGKVLVESCERVQDRRVKGCGAEKAGDVGDGGGVKDGTGGVSGEGGCWCRVAGVWGVC